MNNKNFAGQKLDGRSFRGQDLRGADFSGASLKSCDFRDADLTGANFCNAVFGISVWRKLWKNCLGILFGAVLGTASVAFNFFFVMAVVVAKGGNDLVLARNISILLSAAIALGWVFIIYFSLKFRRPMLFLYYGILIGVVSLSLQLMGGLTAVMVVIPGMAVVAGIFGVAIGVSVAGVGGLIPIMLIVATLVAVGASSGEVPDFSELGLAAMAMTGATLIFMLFGFYVRYMSVVVEHDLLAWHRKSCLIWSGWGGARFSGAKLEHANFGWSDLRDTSLVGSNLVRNRFQHASNFHLARTEETPLFPQKVRVLLSEGRLIDTDFSGLNLRAISFSGLNLSGVNFYRSDLSEVDFCECDLRGADFSEATVLGTNFERAQLTGATIDQWNTDKRTRFDGVDCEYVYTKRDKSFKNPPHGTFKAGEFSKLYQEIANTVDFIVHTPEELQALLRAIESIKQQGGEIVIQSLERKNESVVVRTQSPEAIDKAAIYAQVREEMDSQFQLLKSEYEQQFLAQKFELVESKARHDETRKTMDSLIIGLLNQPSNIIVNDHSRTISNSTLTNSATNLGDHSTVSNNVIEQVADAQLRTDLQKLHALLTGSTLPAYEKKQAQESVTELAQASDKPAAERKSIARRSLAFLKDLREDLGSMADLGVQYGETLARVVLWFQGL